MNAPHATLRVRWNVVTALREVKGLESDQALAAAMGIDKSSVSRVTNGKQQPGPKFQASLCRALSARLGDLFEIVDEAA